MEQYLGRASIWPQRPVYILAGASVVGTKEGEGPLGALFDQIGEDDLFGCANWEEAESAMQKKAFSIVLRKAGLKPQEVRFLYAGDLLGQSIASSFGLEEYQIPFLGVYGACSTCGEALTLATMAISGGYGEPAAVVTSSHFASAEKEFRYPMEYGNQRPLSASWTVTGSGAFLLGSRREGSVARVSGITVGKIVDYGLKDSMNMGACMAPAAASTLVQHFEDFNRTPKDYDCIITGDLGRIGTEALSKILQEQGIDLSGKLKDCGVTIYDTEKQDAHAGGSGCGCCACVLAAYILRELREGTWKKILFLPTGALLSKTSFNEGRSIPAICHAIVLETVS